MNPRIALISVGVSRREYSQFARFMPMTAPGLHYIKAVLEQEGYDVLLVNQTNDGLIDEDVVDIIDGLSPDYVLFNQFFSTRDRIRRIIRGLKGNYLIGVGGHDPTFHSAALSGHEFNEEYSDFDFVWQGEAETKLSAFLKSLEKKKKPQIIKNLESRTEELDSLPILIHQDYQGDVGFLVSSRGCYCNGCDFCTTPSFYKDGWKARSLENVAKELENLADAGKKYIFICDDNFLGFSEKDLDRGNMIIEKCKELELKVMIMTSKEQILRAEEKGYPVKWKGTVFRAFLGIENGDESAIKKIGKRCNVSHHREMSETAVRILYENGIALFLGYINFNPESTFEELENSARFLYENCMEAANFTNLCQGLRMYEGSKILERYKKKGLNNIRIMDGEYRYDFEDKAVGEFFEYLDSVRGRITDSLDNVNYETTDMIYINQIQDTELGKEYRKMRSRVNELNYNFFMQALEKFRIGKNKEILEELRSEFLIKSEKLLNGYRGLHFEILSLSEHK